MVKKVMIPAPYDYLNKEGAPKILLEMMALYGTRETPGPGNNPVIMAWAKELGKYVGMDYTADSIPWCGIGMGIACLRAGYEPPAICARASSWDKWGTAVHINDACLGDVLRFERAGGGHVGIYVGEDKAGYFHVLGTNQSDAANITRIAKNRCIAVRRCPWKIAQPQSLRQILLAASGKISENES